ncbi:MAG TPA: hypothetical protein EYQ02_11780 [Microbacterium sp.]|nr:hypothetical protein [Microbacterium sp.]
MAIAQPTPIDSLSAQWIDLGLHPVRLGQSGDGYPSSLRVVGTIEQASPADAHCGVMFFSGTVAVRLDDPTSFPGDLVRVVVPCLGPGEYTGRRIRLNVVKLDEGREYGEAYGSVWNRLTSSESPFYGAATEEDWPAYISAN